MNLPMAHGRDRREVCGNRLRECCGGLLPIRWGQQGQVGSDKFLGIAQVEFGQSGGAGSSDFIVVGKLVDGHYVSLVVERTS